MACWMFTLPRMDKCAPRQSQGLNKTAQAFCRRERFRHFAADAQPLGWRVARRRTALFDRQLSGAYFDARLTSPQSERIPSACDRLSACHVVCSAFWPGSRDSHLRRSIEVALLSGSFMAEPYGHDATLLRLLAACASRSAGALVGHACEASARRQAAQKRPGAPLLPSPTPQAEQPGERVGHPPEPARSPRGAPSNIGTVNPNRRSTKRRSRRTMERPRRTGSCTSCRSSTPRPA